MALEIKWTKRADQQFDKIIEYLLHEWGDRVASSFIKGVYDFLDLLSEHPRIGSIENIEKEIRGFTILKQINIFYSFDKNRITVLNFFDNRQNPKKKRF